MCVGAISLLIVDFKQKRVADVCLQWSSDGGGWKQGLVEAASTEGWQERIEEN
jgi:hypothetical protein